MVRPKKTTRGLLDIEKKNCRQSLPATSPCRASAGGGLPGGGSGLWGHRVSPAEQILRRGPFPSSQKVPPLTSGGVWESFNTSGPQFPHLLKGSVYFLGQVGGFLETAPVKQHMRLREGSESVLV